MKLTTSEFLTLYASAWKESATTENVMSGFCTTGLFPLDRSKVSRDAFLSSQTIEQPKQQLLNTSLQHAKCKGMPLLTC